MNATDEKSRMPIPEDCRRCMHCETWVTRNVERNLCLRGHTMQPGCGWQRERTESVAEVRG